MGADYLGIIESEARSILTDHFISNLPYNKLVKVSPERIAEWSFIKEALIWPSSINRLKRIAELECKPLEKVIPKYVKTLNQKGKVIHIQMKYLSEEKREIKVTQKI